MPPRELREAYWLVRKESAGLRRETARFEGTRWHSGEGYDFRRTDGYELRAWFDRDGDPAVTVLFPDGRVMEFA